MDLIALHITLLFFPGMQIKNKCSWSLVVVYLLLFCSWIAGSSGYWCVLLLVACLLLLASFLICFLMILVSCCSKIYGCVLVILAYQDNYWCVIKSCWCILCQIRGQWIRLESCVCPSNCWYNLCAVYILMGCCLWWWQHPICMCWVCCLQWHHVIVQVPRLAGFSSSASNHQVDLILDWPLFLV
jgi:hypothetical protein